MLEQPLCRKSCININNFDEIKEAVIKFKINLCVGPEKLF